MELFKQGYSCSQSIVGAFCDDIEIDFETAVKLSSSFGGGMGKLREVCGAVSGMFMVVGLKYGYTDPNDTAAKTEHYKLIQSLAKQFSEHNGSIICRELLGLDTESDNYIPEERTKEYYLKRPCIELVGDAAEIVDKFINKKLKLEEKRL
jgi:C_GCAxxG_C_C family probable redox protein